MAMVVRANKRQAGIGGHISTFASAATLYEVAFNHFFRGRADGYSGDQIYFQGHASPGIYPAPFWKAGFREKQLENFRRELAPGGGLSLVSASLADAGFLGVSDGLDGARPDHGHLSGPLQSIPGRPRHQAVHQGNVWAFLGDGETDEPETLGAITLASREKLDNLIFVINCNLQRLDGPVRGNGKIIQELEATFRGAGWNVIKVIWGSDWDPLLDKDSDGLLVKRMGEVVDGEYQKILRRGRRLHPRALLRQISASCCRWSSISPTSRLRSCAAAATIPKRSMPPTRPPWNTRLADGNPGQDDQRLWPGREPAKAATSPTSRRNSAKRS